MGGGVVVVLRLMKIYPCRESFNIKCRKTGKLEGKLVKFVVGFF